MKAVLDIIKENSGIKSNSLRESDSSDIATTQDFLSGLIDEKYNDSLAYQICEILPLKSTLGRIYASKLNTTTNNFEVVKKDINVSTNKVITGYTKEVWDDMIKQFGTTADEAGSNILSNFSAIDESKDIVNLLEEQSEVKTPLTVNIASVGWIANQITQKISESVIEMNRHSFKTLDSFCILSGKWASALMGHPDIETADNKGSLFIGRFGRIDFYVNPIPNNSSQFDDGYTFDFESEATGVPDYAYVGLKSKVSGNSSLIFAPYSYEIQKVVDPDTSNPSLFMYNRYGLEVSPLHDKIEKKGMLHKFEITAG